MKHTYVRKSMEVVQPLNFTRLCTLTYTASDDAKTPEHKWEMVQRTTRSTPVEAFEQSPAPICTDAVEICATVHKGDERYVIVVAQYRPPLDAVCLEFPAGLVDAGENCGQAAIRELHEETGYIAGADSIVSISPPLSTEPGLTDSCCVLVHLRVDGSRSENQNPQQQLDGPEDIEVLLIPIHDPHSVSGALRKAVEKYEGKGQRAIVDAKLYTYMNAISHAGAAQRPSTL